METAESKLTLVDGEPVLGDNPVKLKRLKSSAEKAKEEEVSIRESLEAKEALLARALDEIGVHFFVAIKRLQKFPPTKKHHPTHSHPKKRKSSLFLSLSLYTHTHTHTYMSHVYVYAYTYMHIHMYLFVMRYVSNVYMSILHY